VRFSVPYADRDNRGLPDFDREVSGPVTAQIRDFRGLIRGTGFFKVFKDDGPKVEASLTNLNSRGWKIRIPS